MQPHGPCIRSRPGVTDMGELMDGFMDGDRGPHISGPLIHVFELMVDSALQTIDFILCSLNTIWRKVAFIESLLGFVQFLLSLVQDFLRLEC